MRAAALLLFVATARGAPPPRDRWSLQLAAALDEVATTSQATADERSPASEVVRKAAEAAAAEKAAGEEAVMAAAEKDGSCEQEERAPTWMFFSNGQITGLGSQPAASLSLHAGKPTITFHKFGSGTIYINEPYPAVINWPAEEFASLLDGMATAKLPDGDDNRLAMMIAVRDNAKERHTMVVELLRAKTLVVGAHPPIRPIPRAIPSPPPPLSRSQALMATTTPSRTCSSPSAR